MRVMCSCGIWVSSSPGARCRVVFAARARGSLCFGAGIFLELVWCALFNGFIGEVFFKVQAMAVTSCEVEELRC